MDAGASINSKAPCHLYSSRLAGGEKICRISPEGLPFTSCLKFNRESTFLSTVDPGLKIAGVTNEGDRNIQE